MRNIVASALLAAVTLVSASSPAFATNPVGFGTIWLDGEQVRTLVLPSAMPQAGRDDFYRVPGTGGVAAVGPGTGNYHGGSWKVYDVTWNVAPYLLTSAEAVLAAAASGNVAIVRNADADFRCPIQP